MSRKLEEKRERRLAEERRRAERRKAAQRRNFTTIGIAVAVAAVVVFLIVREQQAREAPPVRELGVAASEAGCTDVQDFDDLGAAHLQPGQEPPEYNSSPPTSGPHDPAPADPGFYAQPMAPTTPVHNMEHGMIVIWYSPGADQETKDMIREYVEAANEASGVDLQRQPLVAVPYEGLEPNATYAMTGWTHLQSCEQFSSEAVDRFREQFQGASGDAPENEKGIAPTFEAG